jgi:mono/diheme cytochrome c family protein
MAFVITRLRPFSFPVLFAIGLIVLGPSQIFASKKNDDEKAGALLFRDKGCAYCHGVGGVGTGKAPSLAALPTDREWPPEKITNQILNGGQKMPPFRDSVTDDEAAQLVAYLRAKNKPPAPTGTTAPANLPPAQ